MSTLSPRLDRKPSRPSRQSRRNVEQSPSRHMNIAVRSGTGPPPVLPPKNSNNLGDLNAQNKNERQLDIHKMINAVQKHNVSFNELSPEDYKMIVVPILEHYYDSLEDVAPHGDADRTSKDMTKHFEETFKNDGRALRHEFVEKYLGSWCVDKRGETVDELWDLCFLDGTQAVTVPKTNQETERIKIFVVYASYIISGWQLPRQLPSSLWYTSFATVEEGTPKISKDLIRGWLRPSRLKELPQQVRTWHGRQANDIVIIIKTLMEVAEATNEHLSAIRATIDTLRNTYGRILALESISVGLLADLLATMVRKCDYGHDGVQNAGSILVNMLALARQPDSELVFNSLARRTDKYGITLILYLFCRITPEKDRHRVSDYFITAAGELGKIDLDIRDYTIDSYVKLCIYMALFLIQREEWWEKDKDMFGLVIELGSRSIGGDANRLVWVSVGKGDLYDESFRVIRQGTIHFLRQGMEKAKETEEGIDKAIERIKKERIKRDDERIKREGNKRKPKGLFNW